jgi:pseudaminic acid cytidylyltransferase
MTKSLAVIPARRNSKRIPNKSVADFCGKPIIAYSLEAARDSGLFDEIHVSTDDETIAGVAENLGFEVGFMRPAELADDHTPLVLVLRWVLTEFQRCGRSFDDVCLLLPCAPLIQAKDLIRGHEALRKNGWQRPVISVARYPAPVEWAYSMTDECVLKECQPGMFAVRSQDIEVGYYDTGTLAFFPTQTILDPSYQGGGEMTGIVLPPERAVDIDEPEDLKYAEILYRGLR